MKHCKYTVPQGKPSKLCEHLGADCQGTCHVLLLAMQEGICLHELLRDSAGLVTDYRILHVNPAYEQILSKPAATVINRLATEVYDSDTPPFLEDYCRVVTNQQPEILNIHFPPMDKWFRISATPLGGDLFATIFTDVTLQTTLQEELSSSEARLNQLLETLPIGVTESDRDGRIVIANDAFHRIHGRQPGSIPGLYIWDLETDPEQADQLKRYYQELLQREIPDPTPYETTIQIDGENRQFEVNWRQRHDSAGNICGFVSIIRDMTEQRLLEADRKRLQEQETHALVGRIAGKMAHDFNNVLGIIVGLSDILLEDSNAVEIREELQLIVEAGIRGRDITRNLQAYARSSCPRLQPMDPALLLESVVQRLEVQLSAIELNQEITCAGQRIMVEPGLLENAFYNLLLNAIHAVGKTENPRIQLELGIVDHHLRFAIHDNGCGVPAGTGDMVFDPAFTLKGSHDHLHHYPREIRGSGFGLANVKRCAVLHGGQVDFQSDRKSGTVFVLQFPCQTEIPTVSSPAGTYKPRTRIRTLLVEDEPALARLMKKQLLQAGHSVDVALNGETANRYLKQNQYQLISLDFLLPDMKGSEVYQQVRKEIPDLPVIFVSGNLEYYDELAEICTRDSNTAFISKPVRTSEYLAAIDELLERNSVSPHQPGQG